jgi:hypothetical protein
MHSDRQRSAMDHLDGNLLFELGIRSLGEVHLPHPADTQGAQHTVRPNAISHHFWSMLPRVGSLQTWQPLRAGASYVYESRTFKT